MADFSGFNYSNKFNSTGGYNTAFGSGDSGFGLGGNDNLFNTGDSAFSMKGFNQFSTPFGSMFNASNNQSVGDFSKVKDVSAYVHNFFNSGNEDFMSSLLQFQMPSFSTWGGGYNSSSTNYPRFEAKNCDRNVLTSKLNSSFKGSLAGKGTSIIAAADKYGLDPALFASILANESGYGKYGSGNNFGGLMDPRTGCATKQKFATVEQGLDRVAANLRKNYISKGLTTPATIGPKYCPVGAANDPTGLNGNWIGGVTRIYQKFTA